MVCPFYLLKESAFSFIALYYYVLRFFFIYFCSDLDFFPSTNFGVLLFSFFSCFRCKVSCLFDVFVS